MISPEDKNNREIVMVAVKQNGFALQWASEELKGDRDIVMEAVKQNGDALQHASAELHNDREFVIEAVKRKGYALQWALERGSKSGRVAYQFVIDWLGRKSFKKNERLNSKNT